MLPEFLQDRATSYVSGALSAPERENFELLLEFNEELRALVLLLRESWSTALVASLPRAVTEPGPSPELRARILRSIGSTPQRTKGDAVVVTDAGGRILWFNPAFTAMCGYTLEELKGRKPGALLQGQDTDPHAVDRIRTAVRERRSCRETLVNYHKDGTRYEADIRIEPMFDDAGRAHWFVARERILAATTAA